MSNMTIHDVPEELRVWLREKARTHHQSISQEILGLLASIQPGHESGDAFAAKLARIEELCRHCADASFLDGPDDLGKAPHGEGPGPRGRV